MNTSIIAGSAGPVTGWSAFQLMSYACVCVHVYVRIVCLCLSLSVFVGHVSIGNITLDDNSVSVSITDELVSSSCDAFPTCKLTRLN